MSLIVQREVGSSVESFAEGLRAVLREDPDVILVGELRDPETIMMAMMAAETGHLVLALYTRPARRRHSIGSSTCYPPNRKPREWRFSREACAASSARHWS